MENLLLLLDELDDAVAVLRCLLPRMLAFLLAGGLFGLCVLAALHWPLAGAITLMLALLVAGVSSLRSKPSLRFRTDP